MRPCGWACAAAVALAAAGAPCAWTDDDLDVVKRALAKKEARTQGHAPSVEKADRPVSGRWVKVRVVEKGSERIKVSVNVPLDLVDVLADLPIDWDCGSRHERHATRTLREILSALKSGEELVHIDDEGTSVRVWVE